MMGDLINHLEGKDVTNFVSGQANKKFLVYIGDAYRRTM
jgi:hypothetical protein